MKKITALFILITLIFSTFVLPKITVAQTNGTDIAYTYQIADQGVVNGDIMFPSPNGFVRGNVPYSNNIFGVYQTQPLIVFKQFDSTNQPIVRGGVTNVNVTTINGDIQEGDYITSSEIAGKGMKATQSGYVLGIALAPFESGQGQVTSVNGQEVTSGQIPVAMRVEYAELTNTRNILRILDYINAAVFRNINKPEEFNNIVRSFGAILVFLASLIFGLLTFSRSIIKGIEALGRNPLAKSSIQIAIALNVFLVFLTALAGIIIAFIILRL